MAKFRKVELRISKANGYGSYYITARYKGKDIKVHTNDSECFDYLNDDEDKERHQQAKRYAYSKVVSAYKDLK
jgi:hypothetical protein